MKKLLYSMAVMVAMCGTACDHYDHAIADQEDRLDILEQSVIKNIDDQVDAINTSLSELESLIENLNTADTEKTELIADLEEQIAAQQEALKQAKKDLAEAYEKAIDDAIKTNNGVITEAYKQAIADAVKDLGKAIDEIDEAIKAIEDRLDELDGDVAALKNRIQSIRFIPEYSDGKVELLDEASLDFMLTPKAAAGEVTKDHVTAFISRTKTRAVNDPTVLEVTSVTGDATSGTLKVAVSAESLPQNFWNETSDANIFICISDGNNDVISELVPIVTLERLDSEEELIAALASGEAKLEGNITLSTPLIIPTAPAATIDLNGYELSYTSSVQGEAMITNKGNLTIKDSKTDGKLSFTYAGAPDTSYGKGNYTISNVGTLTIESGIIENNTAKMSHVSYVIDNNSTLGNVVLTINGGKVINYNSTAIRQFCNGNENTIVVNNGEIEGSRAVWTQLPGNDINSAPVANLTVNGGTLTSRGETSGGYEYKMVVYSYTHGNSVKNVTYKFQGGTFNGDIALLGSSDKASETVEINGGTFNGFDGGIYSWGDHTAAAKAIKITGGTFSDVYPLIYVGSGESTTVKFAEDFATEDYKININSGAAVTLDLNGKTISHKSTKTGANVDFIDVRGTLTVKNGTITTEHIGTNMGWNSSTNVFNVTAGGVLNIKSAVCKNLGGSDMNFVVHLNNWGEVTLNVENSELEAQYVAVRVFNSGYDNNNVTINNTILTGGRCIWVHNYTLEDFGTQEKVDAQKALLKFNDILNAGNTFNYTKAAIRLGFTNSPEYDENGNLL